MAGCCVVLLAPVLAGIGIVVGAFMILQIAFEAVVGTAALPLLVVSVACAVIVLVIVMRALWVRFHDHEALDLPGTLVLPAVLAVVAFVAFCAALVVSGQEFFSLFRALAES